MIQLFDIEGAAVKPSVHCYTIPWLKDIMDDYPKNYIKIYAFLFYSTCPNPDLNPFFNIDEKDKNELILRDLRLELDLNDPIIIIALEGCTRLYQTPMARIALGAKAMLDKGARYLHETIIKGDNKGGNGTFIRGLMKDITEWTTNYKIAEANMLEEQKVRTEGGEFKAYDL